jgi:hypothetical protein
VSLDDKVGRHRARFRKVYPYGNTRRPDVRSFVDAITNTTKSFDFQKIQHDYPYYSVPTYLSTSWAVSGAISYATFLEATETFTNQTSYEVIFSSPFAGTPYLAFAPSQSQFSGSDGQETPNVAWWVTGLTSGGFTANFSAPFTGKITYRGVYTTGSYPIYVNRSTDLSGSYAWVSAGSSSLTNQSSLSMSFAALPSLPEYLNYNPVGSTTDELNIGQTIWAVSTSYAVNELSAPFTGIIHFLAMDTTGSDTNPFTANPDTNYPPTGSFSPADITNLYAWYKYDNLLLSGSTNVSAALDKSGNSRHAVMPTAGQQPTYSATGGANNLPYWTGTDAVSGGRYLLAGVAADWTFLHNGSGHTVFIISKTASTQQNYIFGTQTGTGASLGGSVVRINNTTANWTIGNAAISIISQNFAWTQTSWGKLAFSGSTGGNPDYSVRVNGVDVVSVNESAVPAATTSTQKLGIGSGGGGAYSSAVSFHEVIIYNRELTSSEVSQVESYLSSSYGV